MDVRGNGLEPSIHGFYIILTGRSRQWIETVWTSQYHAGAWTAPCPRQTAHHSPLFLILLWQIHHRACWTWCSSDSCIIIDDKPPMHEVVHFGNQRYQGVIILDRLQHLHLWTGPFEPANTHWYPPAIIICQFLELMQSQPTYHGLFHLAATLEPGALIATPTFGPLQIRRQRCWTLHTHHQPSLPVQAVCDLGMAGRCRWHLVVVCQLWFHVGQSHRGWCHRSDCRRCIEGTGDPSRPILKICGSRWSCFGMAATGSGGNQCTSAAWSVCVGAG